jgi:polysaccharide export outer membrane protein
MYAPFRLTLCAALIVALPSVSQAQGVAAGCFAAPAPAGAQTCGAVPSLAPGGASGGLSAGSVTGASPVLGPMGRVPVQATQGQATQGRATQGRATQGRATQGQATQGQATQGQATQGQAGDRSSAGADADSSNTGTNPAAGPLSEPPSDFQRFAAQSTGQLLPIFGLSLFSEGRLAPVQAVQVPDGYVVGPGDELIIQLYGAVDFVERLVVDRDGRVLIPKIGPVKVAGLRFRDLEGHLARSIGEVYRNFRLSVSMGRLRSIEIYLLGQARAPGRKVVSSLSTLINALFENGGPSARGSLRSIELRRSGRVITRIDLYDFIARGDSRADRPLEPGDIIFIPPVGPQVALTGSVNEPAIYELDRDSATIRSLLGLTGGLPTLAAPQKAQLERVDSSRQPARFIEDITLDPGGLNTPLRGGDVITVFQISPQFANAVTLQGSVAAPMRYAFREGMRVGDLVLNNNFLVPVSYWVRVNSGAAIPGLDRPEVNLEYATIQRLETDRLRTRTIPFNLARALAGDPKENLSLSPGDIVRVYSASEPGAEAIDSVALQAGFVDGLRRSSWREGHRVTDVIPDLPWLREQVVRWVRQRGLMVALPPSEQVLASRDAPGAVRDQRVADVDAANIVRLSAASFQELNLDYADIKRLDPETMRVRLIPFNLSRALAGHLSDNLPLLPGDRISLYTKQEVPVPVARRTRLVKVTGEVNVPGTYQVAPGETLPQIIQKAGGFTGDAYVYGTSFIRESTKIEQQRNLQQLLRTMEADLVSQANFVSQNVGQADAQQAQAMLIFQRQTLERLRTLEVSGRIAFDLDERAAKVELPAIELEDGDSISVPTVSNFVGVFGAVDISNPLLFRSDQRVRDYLDRTGPRPFADLENVVLLRADGTVRTARTVQQRNSFFGWGRGGVLDLQVKPGDTILVPEQIDRRTGYTNFMIGAKDWTQLIYQFGLGAAAFKVLQQ